MKVSKKILTTENVYDGKLIKVYLDTVMINDRTAVRESIKHPGAAGIVAVTGNEEILFIKQFRHAINNSILEVPAGLLEKEETPKECALRELEEETGYKAKTIIKLTEFYTSVGCSDEVCHLYLGMDLSKGKIRQDIDEEILKIVKIPVNKSILMIMKNEIKDSKTIIAVIFAHDYLSKQKYSKNI